MTQDSTLRPGDEPAREGVWKMFDRIAPKYDLLNRLLSFGLDVVWRKRVARYLPEGDALCVVDLATGTADQLLFLRSASPRVAAGTGIDLAEEMLAIGRRKIERHGLGDIFQLKTGDAMAIPEGDGGFDAATISFGIRNVPDVDGALREMHRVLQPGGRALVLEFSLPRNRLIRAVHLFYLRHILPRVGGWVSGDPEAYRYLNVTIEGFPYGRAFCERMEQAGFVETRANSLTFGIASIYQGDKPGMTAPATPITEPERIREVLMDRLRAALRDAAPEPAALVRAEILVEGLDVAGWFAAQPPMARGYWSDRENELELAGDGRADMVAGERHEDLSACLDEVHTRLDAAGTNLRYFGGIRFRDPPSAPEWEAFKGYRFILPQFEVLRRSGVTTFACNMRSDEDLGGVEQRLGRVVFPDNGVDLQPLSTARRVDSPGSAEWGAAVEKALADVEAGVLEKIVLARPSTFEFEEPLNSAHLLKRLKAESPQAFHFCFQPDAGHAFLGASPERLYHRSGSRLLTEALAGTRARGRTEAEDRALEAEMRASAKEQREHGVVIEGIRRALEPIVQDLAHDPEPGVMKLVHNQHLVTRFRGMLAEGVHDGQVLAFLHPTPAVGGSPRERALAEIDALEPFDRGYFAAPVGWVERDAAQFAVGIRAGLVEHNRLHLYSGAGIVAGSTPLEEWQELEGKLAAFLAILS